MTWIDQTTTTWFLPLQGEIRTDITFFHGGDSMQFRIVCLSEEPTNSIRLDGQDSQIQNFDTT